MGIALCVIGAVIASVITSAITTNHILTKYFEKDVKDFTTNIFQQSIKYAFEIIQIVTGDKRGKNQAPEA